MNLLLIAASHRPDSVNRKLAALAATQAEGAGHSVRFPEYGVFDMPIYNDTVYEGEGLPAGAQTFLAHLAWADGLIIASPEYNWSFPGSLKNIIDWASRVSPSPFAGKTVLLLSATPSLRGGITGVYSLKVPLEALAMQVFSRVFVLGDAYHAFNAKADIADSTQRGIFAEIVAGFLAFTVALRKG